ncbi:hypothetical protein R2Q93_02125 [Clostridium perfringens]|nr:hypothetical protein [Clostridium perfringens]
MKNKIVELAIFQPYVYPWSKSELNLSVEEIDNILKDIGLNNEVSRRKAGYELDIISYLVAAKAKDYEDLKKRILEELKDRKYVSEILIKKELSKKHLSNEDELKAYIKFINNNMTIDEKNVFKKAIEIWLVDLFYYYKCAFDSNIKSDSVKEYILQVVEKNYTENKLNPIFIDRLRKIKAFNRAYILELVYKVASNFKNELNELLEKYVSKDNNGTSESNFEDELFDIINDIPDLDLSFEPESEAVDKKSDEAENISEVKDKMKENSSKDKKHDEKKKMRSKFI